MTRDQQQPPDSFTPATPAAAADYVADIVKGLQKMVPDARFAALRHFLDLARAEAELIRDVDREKPGTE